MHQWCEKKVIHPGQFQEPHGQEKGGQDVTISVVSPTLSSHNYYNNKQKALIKHQLCASPLAQESKTSESSYPKAPAYIGTTPSLADTIALTKHLPSLSLIPIALV